MKVIFFDIDGVLNFRGTALIHDECLNELKRIIRETNSNSVISSSWREAFTRKELYTNRDRDLVIRLVKDPELRCLGWTPDIDELNRENEIEAWIESHKNNNIESFAIIDDLDYNFIDKFPCNFVKTAGYWGQGLTKEHADRAIEILNRK